MSDDYDYGEMCRDMRAFKQAKRAKVHAHCKAQFLALPIKHEVKNHGSQYMIRVKNGKPISYYPSGDVWIQPIGKGTPRRGYGLKSLLERIEYCGGQYE